MKQEGSTKLSNKKQTIYIFTKDQVLTDKHFQLNPSLKQPNQQLLEYNFAN